MAGSKVRKGRTPLRRREEAMMTKMRMLRAAGAALGVGVLLRQVPARAEGALSKADESAMMDCVEAMTNAGVESVQRSAWPSLAARRKASRAYSERATALLNESKPLNAEIGDFCGVLLRAADSLK